MLTYICLTYVSVMSYLCVCLFVSVSNNLLNVIYSQYSYSNSN